MAEEQIGDGVDEHFETQRSRPGYKRSPSATVFIGEGLSIDARPAKAADRRHVEMVLPEALAIDVARR
jgi:hypothetical protein